MFQCCKNIQDDVQDSRNSRMGNHMFFFCYDTLHRKNYGPLFFRNGSFWFLF